ncbi:hypothetical protein [Leisingera daeponensis]|uniref:hypothetical protein n=1 Tax=Leisingera daeponensis TaxID=405746 RepID=UPI001C9863B1|nr:hypothetical protein [Leisingera daeponensis]MBY6056348.1 hypothetical protein [Leisingera daeponensis]
MNRQMRPSLTTFEEAAQELGVPKGSLRTAATEHGYLVRMGRAVRIDRNDFEALVEKCKEPAQANASSGFHAVRQSLPTPKESQTAIRVQKATERLKNMKRNRTRGRADEAERTD